MNSCAGFYRQDYGHVYVSDKNMDDVPVYLRNMGMVFQNYAVFPHMTVFENIAFGLKNRKVNKNEIKERVKKSLRMAKLEGYEDRTPDKLGEMQQQRVGLARAMVIEPIVLLMDETLSNLDAKLRIEMREQIRDIQKELDITAIYVTHDQEEALVISDRIAVMNLRKIQQIGEPWEIYKNPKNKFVASFIGSMNFFDGEISQLSGKNNQVILDNKKTCINLDKNGYNKKNICIGIRPEDIKISKSDIIKPAECETTLEGIVKKNAFTGSVMQYVVDCNNILITVSKPNPGKDDFILVDNCKVNLYISAETIMFFDPDSGERR